MKRKTNKAVDTTEEVIMNNLSQINRDTLVAVMVVSLTINLFVLVGWVTLQVTTAYDPQVASFLFTR